MSMGRVLLVDDDKNLREVVRYALVREGFLVEEASDGASAVQRVGASPFDLLVLDVMMPEMDGLEVCRRVRKTSQVPILFLSSRGEELDKVVGLELGGDDYLAKPFSTRELTSRVKAILRRSRPAPAPAAKEEVVRVGNLALDVAEHRVTVGTIEVELTATEFRLLRAFMSRPGRVYPRDELMALAYEDAHVVSERTLDSHVRGIRAKLREAGVDPIETVHGVGYRMARPT
jgi:two-component system, OmpR family, response regulator